MGTAEIKAYHSAVHKCVGGPQSARITGFGNVTMARERQRPWALSRAILLGVLRAGQHDPVAAILLGPVERRIGSL